MIKNSITQITPHYTTKRMLDDYYEKFYNKLCERNKLLCDNNFSKAIALASWKEKMAMGWNQIEVVNYSIFKDRNTDNLSVGDLCNVSVEIDKHELDDDGIGIELVVMRTSIHNNDKLYDVIPLQIIKKSGSHLFFGTQYQLNYAGGMKFALRMYPSHELLPHRMDFCYVRWIS